MSRSTVSTLPKPTWGGKRAGAGRPPLTKARCYCGKHTLARAVARRLKCRRRSADPL